jgi:hypothetical protein
MNSGEFIGTAETIEPAYFDATKVQTMALQIVVGGIVKKFGPDLIGRRRERVKNKNG